LPEPVPPEMTTLQRTLPMISRIVRAFGVIEPKLTSCAASACPS
jgi:hypothetical protein